MFDCSKEIRKFHDEQITLKQNEQSTLRGHRDANQKRIKDGLEKRNLPKVQKFVKQGSYSMRTMVQHPENDYDIDDGVVFLKADLVGPSGADKSALDARKMICDILQDQRFNKQPECKKNCVRVYYNAGYHIDVPVYRKNENQLDTVYEIASSQWKISNPEGVNQWFDERLKFRKMFGDNNNQLRRMVRYLKKFSKSRKSWCLPSGFALTVLADETLIVKDNDDEALYELFVAIKSRLDYNLTVSHPVLVGETITKTHSDPDMILLKDKLVWAIDKLHILHDEDCTKKTALKAWGEVFNTNFFDEYIDEDDASKLATGLFIKTPEKPVDKKGGGQYANV